MVQTAFALIASVPIQFFLSSKAHALALTMVLVVGLWIVVQVTVGLGRMF